MVAEVHKRLTEDDVHKWSSWVKPFPLPDYLAPTGGAPLEGLDEDVLLEMPPHLIVHAQRTAAQKGLQVVSPRQTPITWLMSRPSDGPRDLGDHVVGSTASPGMVWPTLDGDDLSDLLPDEPLPPYEDDVELIEKTKTTPLTRASELMADPILACLIKGRAVIDILRRQDVMGGAEELASLLARAWGVCGQDFMDMDAFTLGVDGPLLRHAIKVDDVYPMVHAPIHKKRSVSVAAFGIERGMLPDDTAMDWRRMRVFCEAVFLMSCSTEGIPLSAVKARPPPGDPSAPIRRDNVLGFAPAPCTAWTFEARTFSLCPVSIPSDRQFRAIPKEVLEALSRYVKTVRPMSYAMTAGHRAMARKSTAVPVVMAPGETISDLYSRTISHFGTGAARGRNASATVRNAIYEALDNAPQGLKLRLARYMYLARTECADHLGVFTVPDVVIDRVASKFVEIGDTLRGKMAIEASKRGSSVGAWWEDITSQVPDRYKDMAEGTMGWAKVGFWLAFKSPSDKWDALVHAMHANALRDLETKAVGGVALPSIVGSVDRLMAAAKSMVKGMTRAFFGYYMGVADVGLAVADAAQEMGKHRTADQLREASYLWALRARMLRGTNISPIAREKATPSQNHLRVRSEPVDILLKPAPYRAYETYKKHVQTSELLSKEVKKMIRDHGSNT